MAFNVGGIYLDIKADARQVIQSLDKLHKKVTVGAKEMSSAYNAVASSMSGISRTGRRALLAITGAVTAATYASAKYEKQLAQVSTMLSGEGMDSMEAYKAQILDLGVAMGESTGTLSKGLYDILSASVAPTEALGVLEVSAKAAAAGLTDTGTAADAVTTIMNSYGMAAADATVISDKLFATVYRGKTDFAQLAPAIGMVASTAAQSGLSLDELSGALSTATRNGVKTRVAITGVNSMMMSFLKPTEDAKVAARELGFELNTQTLKTIGLAGVIDILSGATKEQVASVITNRRALKVLMPILGDVDGFYEDIALSAGSAGAAQAAFEKQTGTLAFQMGQLTQAGFKLLVGLGDIFNEAIQGSGVVAGLTDMLSGLGETFSDLGGTGKTFVIVITGIAAAVAALMAIIPTLLALLAAAKVAVAILGTQVAIATGGISLLVAAIVAGGLIFALSGAVTESKKASSAINELSGALNSQMAVIDAVTKKHQGLKKLLSAYDKLVEREKKAVAAGKSVTAIQAQQQVALVNLRNATDTLSVAYNTLTGKYELNRAEVDKQIGKNNELAISEIDTALVIIRAKKSVTDEEVDALKESTKAAEVRMAELTEISRIDEENAKLKKKYLAEVARAEKEGTESTLRDARIKLQAVEYAIIWGKKWDEEAKAEQIELIKLHSTNIAIITTYNNLKAEEIEYQKLSNDAHAKGAGEKEKENEEIAKGEAIQASVLKIARENVQVRELLNSMGWDIAPPPEDIDVAKKSVADLEAAVESMADTAEEGGDRWLSTLTRLGVAYGVLADEEKVLADEREKAYDEASDTVETYYDDLRSNSDWTTDAVVADIQARMDKLKEEGKEGGAVYEALSAKIIIETKKQGAAYTKIWDGVVQDINSAMSDSIADMIKGNKDLEESFRDLGDTIVDSFVDAFAESIVEKLGFDKLFEENILGLGGIVEGLGDTITTAIGGAFSGIFGGGATVVTGTTGAGAVATGEASISTAAAASATAAAAEATAAAATATAVSATASAGAVAAGSAAVSAASVVSGTALPSMAGPGAAGGLAAGGLGAAVVGLALVSHAIMGGFSELTTRYDDWYDSIENIQFVGDAYAQQSIEKLDEMVNATKEFDFVLDDDISKRNLWYRHYVEATGAFSEEQLKQARMIFGIYESAAEKAELAASGFDMSKIEQDADNWRNKSQEIVDAIAAAGISAQDFAGDTQEAINYWMSHEQRDQMPLEGVLENVVGMTDAFAESLAREIRMMDDWALHQFDLNDDFINELISGTPGMPRGGITSETVPGPDYSLSLEKESADTALLLDNLKVIVGEFMDAGMTMTDAMGAGTDEMRKLTIGEREQSGAIQQTISDILGLGDASLLTEDGFNKLLAESDSFANVMGGFTFDEYMDELDWYEFIRSVDLNNFVTRADTQGGETFNDFISRPGRGVVGFSPNDTIIGMKRPGDLNIAGSGGGGGITIQKVTMTFNGDIRTDADYEEIEQRMTDSLNNALKGVS